MKYEVKIDTAGLDKEKRNQLILLLIDAGYAIYLKNDDEVCYETSHIEITKIKER